MSLLETLLDVRSAEFASNRASNEALVEDLQARVAGVSGGGGEKARAKSSTRSLDRSI